LMTMGNFLEGGRNGFLFRELPKNVLIGTASYRYAGWIDQIYSKGRYEKGITRRSHKAGDKTFNGLLGCVGEQLLRKILLSSWVVKGNSPLEIALVFKPELKICVSNGEFLGMTLKTKVQEVTLFCSSLHTGSRELRPMTNKGLRIGSPI